MNRFICFLFLTAVVAMLGIEAGNQPGMTHSGTQPYIRR
jgi:hypothetical protein